MTELHFIQLSLLCKFRFNLLILLSHPCLRRAVRAVCRTALMIRY